MNTRRWKILLLQAFPTGLPFKIAIVPKNKANDGFYKPVLQGCLDRTAKETNATCVYNGTMDANVTGSLEILNALIDDDDIDAISVSVLDEDAYRPVIDRGIAKGKPIITFDSDAPKSHRLAYVGTDNYAMGRELAKLLKQIKPDGGTYGIVSGYGHNLAQRVQGVRDVFADSLWVEVSNSTKNGSESIKGSLDKMWEFVRENPDLGAIIAVVGFPMFDENTSMWREFVDRNRNVLTVLADTLPIQIELMQKNYVDALVGQLPYNMGYLSADTLLNINNAKEHGIPIESALQDRVIFGTHQLEVLRIPLELPPVSFNYNYLGKLAILGYVLCAMIVGGSIGFMGWTWINRKNNVVKASQPFFLIMICVGTLLMGSAIIPLSIDDQTSQRAADIACMCQPWLINVGFTIAFSALFSKTWRLNKIFLNRNPFKRITVTAKDVMLPFAILVTVNVITLSCWTAFAPLHYVRILEDGTDPWGRPIGSYGQCQSSKSLPYLLTIAVVNFTALVFANFQAYRARNVETEYNESTYIAMANASFLQAILVCVPIVFLTRDNPQAYFVVMSAVLVIISGAILVCIFVPKVLAVKNPIGKKGSKRGSLIISGMLNDSFTISSSMRGLGTRQGSMQAGANPVKSILQQFQSLSWQDKTEVMKKLGRISAPPIQEVTTSIPETSPLDSEESSNAHENATV